MLSAVVSFVRGNYNSLRATVEQLELTELCLRLQVITAKAQAECSFDHSRKANTAQSTYTGAQLRF
jgi:hypothetical protein